MKHLIITALILSFFTPVFAADIVNDYSTNLEGCWDLNESSGARADNSTNGNDLTDNNTVGATTTAKFSNAAEFIRSNSEYLSTTDASQTGLDITGDMAIGMWYKPSSDPASLSEEHALMSKWSGTDQHSYLLRYGNDGGGSNRLILIVTSDGVTTTSGQVTTDLGTSALKYVVMNYDASAGSVDFYVDGSQVGTTQTGLATSIFDSTAFFALGAYGDSSNNPIYFADGVMDEVAVWSRLLTGTEITELYNSGTGVACGTIASAVPETGHVNWFR